ncbi:3-phosphoshikimate 1-carboxyvinyltransferase [Sphingomicrobium astaxanthinifaciens]|uniref:3-phosphoshikimate 1-carboxyvinyltransferase n=1 Tax=Sphingomicrobium astaxanthinifaciens TaxID=1227949 RepID=UPI001FCB0F7B|nr:3-phosphoshikimate 1-carboxyvinyltransferase [Sphingomicrobium astaxanthinifaciens]MCJ7421033.1 3-phosphoshikimate 1-carboxyvinyltransferase [Sphingomicrobium astaxanthinifaciens]
MTPLTAHPSPRFGGDTALPGDKSISHRALILAALASGTSRISGLLASDDVAATEAAVAALGARVERDTDGVVHVTGAEWRSPSGPIDCGNSGTSARLLIGAAAGFEGLAATFIGDASLSRRPMNRIVDPLRRMGARIEGGETLPLELVGARLGGIEHESPVASAQVKSAILLAGLRTEAPVRVIEPRPSRDHSEIMLAQFGVEGAVEEVEGGIAIALGARRDLVATDIAVPGDPSSAAFVWAAAAMIPDASVTTRGVLVNGTRTGFLEKLEAMGARVRLDHHYLCSGEPVADVTVAHERLEPVQVGPDEVPAVIDELPMLACVAAMAEGESCLEGIGELRVKESDRVGAVAAGLTANGVTTFATEDSLRILGRGEVPGGRMVSTRHDHRIAMAFLTLGLAARRAITVDDADPIATSFPEFAEVMRGLGGGIAAP